MNRRSRSSRATAPKIGVQLNTRVDGLKLAPVGTLLALKVKPSPSGSDAVTVKLSKSPSSTLFEPTGFNTGGRFTLPTETVTPNAEAYELYLKGRHYFHKFSPECIEQAIDCFSKART